LQKGVSVDLANVNNPHDMKDADKDDAIVVAVTRDGKIYLGNTPLTKEDITSQVKDRLSARLDKPFTSRAMRAPSMAMSLPSWTRFVRPASTNSVCSREEPEGQDSSSSAAVGGLRIVVSVGAIRLLISTARRIPPGAVSRPAESL